VYFPAGDEFRFPGDQRGVAWHRHTSPLSPARDRVRGRRGSGVATAGAHSGTPAGSAHRLRHPDGETWPRSPHSPVSQGDDGRLSRPTPPNRRPRKGRPTTAFAQEQSPAFGVGGRLRSTESRRARRRAWPTRGRGGSHAYSKGDWAPARFWCPNRRQSPANYDEVLGRQRRRLALSNRQICRLNTIRRSLLALAPVTPEVAGSSPVAPAPEGPANRAL